MRVCYISHSLSHFTRPYVEYFTGRGDEVHLISLTRQDLPGAVNHHPLDNEFDPMEAKGPYLWAAARVRRIIRQIRPDIVHAHYLSSNGLMAALSGFHPLVVSARGTDVYSAMPRRMKRWMIRFVMGRAELVNVVSGDLRRCVLSLGVDAGKVLQLTQGVKAERFAVDRRSRREGPPRIVCTRKHLPVYRCDQTVAALAAIAGRGVAFEMTFAATGPLEPELRRQVEACGLGDRVRFLGGFEQAELPAILADADVYVSASRWDGTSPALLEAMASGIVPVVSDIAGNREWLDAASGDLLFDHESIEAQVGCLLKAFEIAQDAGARVAVMERNRQRVMERGDWTTNMRTLAGHYERLIGLSAAS